MPGPVCQLHKLHRPLTDASVKRKGLELQYEPFFARSIEVTPACRILANNAGLQSSLTLLGRLWL